MVENKILDIGCGTGINITFLQKYGKVYGCDMSKEAVQLCHRRGLKNTKVCAAEDLSYPDSYFDIVTSFGVLDCVYDDFTSLCEMYRVCKSGGLILITTPAIPFLTKLKSEHDLSQHLVRRHSKKRLRKLITLVGFSIKRLTYMNMFLCPLVISYRIVKKIVQPSMNKTDCKSDLKKLPNFVNSILFNLLKFESNLIKYFNLPIGLTLVCVAKKD